MIEDAYYRIDYELNGIDYLLTNCRYLDYKICYMNFQMPCWCTEKMISVWRGSESRSSPTIRFIWKKNTKSDKNKAVSR